MKLHELVDVNLSIEPNPNTFPPKPQETPDSVIGLTEKQLHDAIRGPHRDYWQQPSCDRPGTMQWLNNVLRGSVEKFRVHEEGSHVTITTSDTLDDDVVAEIRNNSPAGVCVLFETFRSRADCKYDYLAQRIRDDIDSASDYSDDVHESAKKIIAGWPKWKQDLAGICVSSSQYHPHEQDYAVPWSKVVDGSFMLYDDLVEQKVATWADAGVSFKPEPWQPTEQDYRECCGVWVLKTRPEDRHHTTPDRLVEFYPNRAEFDRLHTINPWIKIESIPEQCIPMPEPIRESYNCPFPMLAGVDIEPHPLDGVVWRKINLQDKKPERVKNPYPLLSGVL